MKKSISNSSSEYVEETFSDYEERVSDEKEMSQSLMINCLQQRIIYLEKQNSVLEAKNVDLEFELSQNKLQVEE